MFGVMKEEKQGSMRVFRAEFGVSLVGLRERPGDPCCSGEKKPTLYHGGPIPGFWPGCDGMKSRFGATKGKIYLAL